MPHRETLLQPLVWAFLALFGAGIGVSSAQAADEDAERAATTGQGEVGRVLGQGSGQFEFFALPPGSEIEGGQIDPVSVTYLLMEHARREDESAEAARRGEDRPRHSCLRAPLRYASDAFSPGEQNGGSQHAGVRTIRVPGNAG